MSRHYHHRRPRERSSRNPRLELVLSAVVVALVIVALVVFLVVYHDFPLRVSGQ